ncbi:MAG: hypothetical protein ACTHKE_09220 [Sphingomicrobium sp.]
MIVVVIPLFYNDLLGVVIVMPPMVSVPFLMTTFFSSAFAAPAHPSYCLRAASTALFAPGNFAKCRKKVERRLLGREKCRSTMICESQSGRAPNWEPSNVAGAPP